MNVLSNGIRKYCKIIECDEEIEAKTKQNERKEKCKKFLIISNFWVFFICFCLIE